MAVRDRTGVIIEEAFMACTHPQWVWVIDLVRSGRIGHLRYARMVKELDLFESNHGWGRLSREPPGLEL